MQESSCLCQVECNSQFHIDLSIFICPEISLWPGRKGKAGLKKACWEAGWLVDPEWTFSTDIVDVVVINERDAINRMQCSGTSSSQEFEQAVGIHMRDANS
ncbi:hypothetical protein GALMADRAFT_1208171 [Galerina marginata CBS 339.88]|uniref:Uncharacterized protein n=1 Tax=Galerina marginata (strain CBS 339.88) TaxID=685588 RepID=A0A067S5Z3_GALM3|nr:hypothetical protein GALMADRAFT_1208171 [Galerina marginata CBS 339.88]